MRLFSAVGRLLGAYCLVLLIFSCGDDPAPGSVQGMNDAGDAASGVGASAGQQNQAGSDVGGNAGTSSGGAGGDGGEAGSGGAGGDDPDAGGSPNGTDGGLLDAAEHDANVGDAGDDVVDDASSSDPDSGSTDDDASNPEAEGGVSDPLSVFSDEFDDASTLGDWLRIYQTEQWSANQLQTFNIDQADAGTSRPGFATLVPYANSWYGDYRGELTYKVISGDFVVTARLEVSNLADTGAPNSLYSLAGLMVRKPRTVTPATWSAGGENHLFIAAGSANSAGNNAIYISSTTTSTTVLAVTSVAYSEVDLRIVRIGQYLVVLKRQTGSAWTVHQRY
ncbi:MAG TPA: hypothetical protein VHO25_14450, partial [Polyangiaceae bacterium]|nr:hypothetical protein [Polyangiaceae bacterium]